MRFFRRPRPADRLETLTMNELVELGNKGELTLPEVKALLELSEKATFVGMFGANDQT